MDSSPNEIPIISHTHGGTDDPPAVVLGFVVIKAIGLWFITSLLQIILLWFAIALDSNWSSINGSLYNARQLLPSLGYVVAGVALIAYAKPLARRFFVIPGVPMSLPQGNTLVAIISVGTGLFVAASAIGHVAAGVIEVISALRVSGGRFSPDQLSPTFVSAVGQLAVGCFLFLRPNWVVGRWQKHSRMPSAENG